MGSKTFDGVWFIAYTKDHLPPHVHGFYAETRFLSTCYPIAAQCAQGGRKILKVAAEHAQELHELWEKANGSKA